jgi:hypothetical protein
MTDLTKILNNPEEHYPGNFDTPQRANAMLTGLCQDAANEIDRLNAEVERLKANIALDKMAKNARELGLDYEPAVQEKCFLCGERVDSCASDVCPKSAQPAVQEGRDWSLLAATQESLREHMAEIKRLKAAQPAPVQEPVAWVNHGENRITRATGWDGYGPLYTTPPAPQPVPVKTYSGGKPWPVAPAPDPAPIIQQLVTALEGSGTRMRTDQWYIEIEAVAAGKFYLNSKGEGL